MENMEKLIQAFADALVIDTKDVADTLEYNSISEWDSVGHMRLVAAIENTFDIMLDTEDIIDMSSFGRAQEIVAKYGVVF